MVNKTTLLVSECSVYCFRLSLLPLVFFCSVSFLLFFLWFSFLGRCFWQFCWWSFRLILLVVVFAIVFCLLVPLVFVVLCVDRCSWYEEQGRKGNDRDTTNDMNETEKHSANNRQKYACTHACTHACMYVCMRLTTVVFYKDTETQRHRDTETQR